MCIKNTKIFLVAFLFYNTASADLGCNEALTDTYSNESFEIAVLNQDVEQVRLLIKLGIDPNITNSSGETLLMRAVLGGNLEIIKALLESDLIKVNQRSSWRWIKGWTPLMVAAAQGEVLIVRLLSNHLDIEMNAKNEWEYTAVMLAVKGLHVPVVKFLANDLRVTLDEKNHHNKDVMEIAPLLKPNVSRFRIIEILENALYMRGRKIRQTL